MVGPEKREDGVNGGLLQAKTELDPEESHIHIPDLPKTKFGFSDFHSWSSSLRLVTSPMLEFTGVR